jgi:uncharacterized protein (DUF58 family)
MDRGAWRDFFITVFLLGIAFVIALLSSVAAQQNMTRLAAIAAAISLLLAVIGAIYIVPRLARKVQLEFLRFAVRTTVTVEGLFFVVLLVVIGFAAWNTANNLLYLILSAMLAFLVTANMISRLSLADLSIQLRFPDHIFAGETASLSVTLNNHKRIVPTFSLIVEPLSEPDVAQSRKLAREGAGSKGPPAPSEDSRGEAGRPSAERDAARRAPRAPSSVNGSAGNGAQPNRRRRSNQVQEPLGKLAHFILVPPGTSAKQRIEYKFGRRGGYPITAFRISTRFPTGFFKKWRKIEAAGEIVIYPKPRPLDDFYHALPMLAGQVSSHLRGTGDDLYGLRRYHPSDHIRFIDWKATAKSRELIVRDHMREDERRLTIVFDTSQPAKNDSRKDSSQTEPDEAASAGVFEERFEAAIVMAASLAKHFIQEGAEVELLTLREDEWVKSGKGVDHLNEILRVLATLEPDTREDLTSPGKPDKGDKEGSHHSAGISKADGSSPADGSRQTPQARKQMKSDETRNAGSLWRMMEEMPVLADERRFKVFITSAAKGTIPASIWRSAHVVFMEDLGLHGRPVTGQQQI